MTPQENSLLEDFLGRLQAAGNVNKNVEADNLIHARLDGHPDATYLLVQRCLLVERALAEANAQIASLKQQASGGGSFLGGAPEGFGRAPSQAFTPDPRWEQRPEAQQSPPPGYAQPQPQSWKSRWFGGGGAPAPAQQAAPAAAGPSFLGQAATTAAGVAGGMFLFNGIEHLIGGGHNGGFGGNNLFGNNDAGSLGGPMTENITENVFVDDDRNGGGNQQGFMDNTDNSSWADNDSGGSDYSDDSDNFI